MNDFFQRISNLLTETHSYINNHHLFNIKDERRMRLDLVKRLDEVQCELTEIRQTINLRDVWNVKTAASTELPKHY